MKKTTAHKNISQNLKNAVKVIERWLEYQVYIREIPGLSIGIVHDGQPLLLRGYGVADVTTQQPATAETCYRIASISKTFTATAIMQLVEQRKIKLDDPVRKYLPWFAPQGKGEVTIRHLLSHGSGLTRDGSTPHWEEGEFPDAQQLQADVHDAHIFPPGDRFKYSNWGFSILGQVIEEVSHMTYADYLQQNILNPLQLVNTSVEATDKTKQLLATGYSRRLPGQSRTEFPYRSSRAMAPAAGLISSVIDLTRYMKAHHPASGQLLKKRTKEQMQRRIWQMPGGNRHYGLGFTVYYREGQNFPGHGAGINGYGGNMQMDTKNKFSVVILANAIGVPTHPMVDNVYRTLHYFLASKHKRPTRERVANPERYEGRFTGVWEEVDIVAIDDALWLLWPSNNNPLEDAMQLSPINEKTFRITTGDPWDLIGEKVVFHFDKEGNIESIKVGPNPLKKFQL